MVTVSKDGPYLITGGVELIGDNIESGDGAWSVLRAICEIF